MQKTYYFPILFFYKPTSLCKLRSQVSSYSFCQMINFKRTFFLPYNISLFTFNIQNISSTIKCFLVKMCESKIL